MVSVTFRKVGIMKALYVLNAALLCALSGCERAAPIVDPQKPVVDGVLMTQPQYLRKYCLNLPTDRTCIEVRAANSKDGMTGKMPSGW
jgi:hypothetical protein